MSVVTKWIRDGSRYRRGPRAWILKKKGGKWQEKKVKGQKDIERKGKEQVRRTFEVKQLKITKKDTKMGNAKIFRHGSQIRLQISAASPTNRPQPKVIKTIVMIKLKLWPAAGCKAKVAAELSSRPLTL